MIEFAAVEEAFARVHGVTEDGRMAFRGRLNFLKKLGAIRSSGGRGLHLAYTMDDVWTLALALELLEFGLSPADVRRTVEAWRANVLHAFNTALDGTEDLFIAFRADWLALPSTDKGDSPLRWMQARRESQCDPRDMMAWLGPRFGLFNVSVIRRKTEAALAEIAGEKAAA
ncbi:hypothetical protein AMST5_00065 [freshwater sediment metagenome]|uniref:Uncharacterized protein n=1 Tax=freshwater sediment metagenome TaxID=556182 RepID=A0AA48RCI3_9ZZZZ